MMKIYCIGEKLDKLLKKQEIRLAHAPNGHLCWASKNLVGEIRYFDVNAPWPSKICRKFSKSKSYKY